MDTKSKNRKQRHQQKPREHTDIALERIRTLFEEADKAFSAASPSKNKATLRSRTRSQAKPSQNLSARYLSLARKIAMKYKTPIPTDLKKRFCKSCGVFLKTPVNCRVRLNNGKAVYTCLACGSSQRYPYAKRASKPSNTQKTPGQKVAQPRK